MSIAVIIFLVVVGALVMLFLGIVVMAIVRTRRMTRQLAENPPPPEKCPACGGGQLDIYRSGLWDGTDEAGRSTGGSFQVSTCKSCGAHCRHTSTLDHDAKAMRYDGQILTEEEWQRETGPHEKWKRQAAEWPFIAEDPNRAA